MTGQERKALRLLISEAKRSMIVDSGCCKWCLAELPEDSNFRGNRHSKRRLFCNKQCWAKWSKNQRRRMVAA